MTKTASCTGSRPSSTRTSPRLCWPSELDADLLVIATDVDGVYTDWGTPQQARLGRVTPDELTGLDLPAGSMGPKVQAACGFARTTGKEAVIGSLADIADIVAGTAGTRVRAS